MLIAFAAFFFAADLAFWHAGIHMTKLGNATLFGNVSSFAFAAWGLWLARKWPSLPQGSALFLAAVGAGPVYRLLGKHDLGTSEFPPIETPLVEGEIAFRQHACGHTTGPNWPFFLDYTHRYCGRGGSRNR